MITWDQTVDLVTLAAAYDFREADETDVRAWHMVATAQDWDAVAAQRMIVEHYSTNADRGRITPAHISDRLRAIRRAAAETFEDPVIPASLSGRDYPAWYRAQQRAHIDACLARWAETGEEPRRGAIEGNRYGSIAELAASAPDDEVAYIVGEAYDRAMARRIPGPEDFEAERAQLP